MFRIQDNVPEVYIQQSRDFQLLSRLFDTLLSGVKYDIDTVVNILDASKARDTMLSLMCTKVGFFTREEIDAQVLKYIIASFPYIVRNKGTVEGIQLAVNTILKAENTTDIYQLPIVKVVNAEVEDKQFQPYTVYIYTTISAYNRRALKELLQYVLPTGYNYQLRSYSKLTEDQISLFEQSDYVDIWKAHMPSISRVRSLSEDISDTDSRFIGRYDVSEVVSINSSESSNQNPDEVAVTNIFSSDGSETV